MKEMSTQHSILTLVTLSMALLSACNSTTSPVKPPPRVETLTGQINNRYTATITVLGN
jgi:predicted component of type VI protein secretion system